MKGIFIQCSQFINTQVSEKQYKLNVCVKWTKFFLHSSDVMW